MKTFGIAAGLVALLSVSTANAAIIYDTTTNIVAGTTGTTSNRSAPGTGIGPIGGAFSTSVSQQIDSIKLDVMCGLNLCNASSTGSTLVYLVPGTATTGAGTGTPTFSNVNVTGGSNITLNGAVYVNSILDSSILSTTALLRNYKTVTPASAITIGAGSWWVVLIGANDNNNNTGHVGIVPFLRWEQIPLATANLNSPVGIPGGGVNELVRNNGAGGFTTDAANVYVMQINATVAPAPEPASLALLGAGLAGLGIVRRRAAKKAGR